MIDNLTAERRSTNMARIRSTGTLPEHTVRRALHALGFRYRLHRRDLPGRPDLTFPARRKVIFVHGCFWHQHTDCREGRVPGSNRSYWEPKFARNSERHRLAEEELVRQGWRVLTVWECEIERNLDDVVAQAATFLRA